MLDEPGDVVAAASRNRLTDWLLASALALLTAALFSPALSHEFVAFDDNVYVYDTPEIRRGLVDFDLVWLLTEQVGGNWHPLTVLSHQLDCQLFGLDPHRHHRTNVVLHAINAAMCFGAMRALGQQRWTGVWVAALFAWHPLRVESAAWVAERKDLLSGTFWFIGLALYARYARRPRWWRMVPVILAFALGLAAKPMVVTFPCVLLLLDVWPLGRWPSQRAAMPGVGGRLLIEKLPLFGLALADCLVTYAIQAAQAVRSLAILPLGLRVGNAATSYAAYLGDMIWPARLAVFYPHPAERLSWGEMAVACAVLAALTSAAWLNRRRWPAVLVGWLWYLGTLVPVIGLVQVGGAARADRYTYLPSVGIAWALVAVVTQTVQERRRARAMVLAVGCLCLAILAGRTWVQLRTWRNSETLFAHAASVTEGNFLAHTSWADALVERRHLNEALAHYRRALEIMPNYDRALVGQADVLWRARDAWDVWSYTPDAGAEALRALAQANSVGVLPLESLQHYAELVEFMERGRFRAALEAALPIDPQNPLLLTALARLDLREKRFGRALVRLQAALAAPPQPAGSPITARDALQLTAWVLATSPEQRLRNGPQAVELATALVARSPDDWAAHDVLAAARAASGDFTGALSAIDQAIVIAAARPRTVRLRKRDRLVEALRARRQAYAADKVWQTSAESIFEFSSPVAKFPADSQ